MTKSLERHISKERSCISKQSYGKKEAYRNARVLRDNNAVRGEEIHAYPCRYYPHWHVGRAMLTLIEAEQEIEIEEQPHPQNLSVEEMQEKARQIRDSNNTEAR